jgi:RHS repeat-associated protein
MKTIISVRYFLLLAGLILSASHLFAQGLTGPEQVPAGVKTTFSFSDDYLIAQPRWVIGSATVTTYSSGAVYFADVTWPQPGFFDVEFYDGNTQLAVLRVEVTGGCTAPPVPHAGSDMRGTETCGLKSIRLNGSVVPDGMTGLWSVVTGTGGSFSDPANPNAMFSGNISTDYVLRWAITNSGCSSFDDVSIRLNQSPVDAPAVSGEQRFGAGTFLLEASGAQEGTGYRWYDQSGALVSSQSSLLTESVAVDVPRFGTVVIAGVNGCNGPARQLALTIVPMPVIISDLNFLPSGGRVLLSVSKDFDTYKWKDSDNKLIGTGREIQITQPGNYSVEVTESGVSGTGKSLPFAVRTPFAVSARNSFIMETPGKSTAGPVNTQPLNRTTHYLDGLGRPLQVVERAWSPNGKDQVTPFVYDARGRNVRQFLPAVTEGIDGSFNENLLGSDDRYNPITLSGFNDASPYTELTYDNSPLDKVTEILEPGQAWKSAGKSSSFKTGHNIHGTSAEQEQIIVWDINAQTGLPVRKTQESEQVKGGFYATGVLEVKSEKDEEGLETRTYTDRSGKVILKKIQAVAPAVLNDPLHWAQTYYIYDLTGRLRFVLQPELVKNLIQGNRNPAASEIWSLGFRYRYDKQGRVAVIQEPGRDSVYMVYDHRDRVVLSQDGNQRAAAPYRWIFFKYDMMNRMVATGIKDTAALLSQGMMQNVVDNFYKNKTWALPYEQFVGYAVNNVHGYSNRSYPVVTTGTQVDQNRYLRVIYFDQYQFNALWNNSFAFIPDAAAGTAAAAGPFSGVETGRKVKVLDGGSTGGATWLGTVIWYDQKLRPVQVHSENYKGGVDIISMAYDFNGQMTAKRLNHSARDVTWKEQTGLMLQGNKLVRGNATAGWTSGAVSSQTLAAGADGWLEFTATETTMLRAVGLSDQNTNPNYTSVDYAVYLNNTGSISIFEQAAGKFVTGRFGTYRYGDRFRIERKAGTIRYYRNNVLLRSSVYPSTGILMADVSLNSPGSTIAAVHTSFSSESVVTEERYEYDHRGRLLKTRHRIGIQPEVVIASNEYDNRELLKSKALHASVTDLKPKQKVDYRYNVRGWPEAMNGSQELNDPTAAEFPDLFSQEIKYEKTDPAIGNQPRFNGLISSLSSGNYSGEGVITATGFVMQYDPMNRLLSGIQKTSNTPGSWTLSGNEERVTSYDLNGNIRSLNRKAGGVIQDDLLYQYTASSNQLSNIQDRSTEKMKMFVDGNTGTTTEYSYDRNGNLLTDLNKGISQSMQYNFLNLPETVDRGGNRVQYIYTAEGEKIAETSWFTGSASTVTAGVRQIEWCGPIEYDQDQMKMIAHPEGRVVTQKIETIFLEDGTNRNAYTISGSTTSATTINGEKYIAVTSTSTTARSGVQSIGGSLSVTNGERYLVRVKGYRDKGTAKSSNPVYVFAKLNGADLLWPGAAIPASQATEHEVEQIIDVTSTGTLQIGITWSTTVLTGEIFYLNQVEITRVSPSDYDYQYYLKDHLENIRTIFTANPKTDDRLATVEPARASQERKQFLRLDNARMVTSSLFDRTNANLSGTAVRLNGSSNERYGLACSLAVMPGDVIDAEVWTKFVDPNTQNWTSALSSLISLIGSGSTTVVADGASYTTSTSSFPYASLQNTSGSSGTGPRAYLNWLVFDKNFNLLTPQSGYLRMSDISREYGQDAAHERLKIPALRIKEQGFVYIYLSNEESVPLDVYFDDFKVTHKHSPVIRRSEYFPFGMTISQQSRENTISSPLKFNGMKEDEALETGWLWPEKFRTYEPTQARFQQADPVVKDHESLYAWNTNNPVLYPDPLGADSAQRARALKEAEQYVRKNPDPRGTGGYGFAGYHSGTPGLPVDCSGMVSQCAAVSGFGTLNNYVKGKPDNTGVKNILDQPLTREVPINEIVDGNIVVFPNKSHVAFISDIVRDNMDQVTGFTMIHSERKGGPNKDIIDLNNSNSYYVRKYIGAGGSRVRFYSWDTPDKPATPFQNQILKPKQ